MADRSDHTGLAVLAGTRGPSAGFAGGLLHYRPWQGTLRTAGAGMPLLFLAGQTALLLLITAGSPWLSASPAWPAARVLLALLFVGLWGLAARSRAWPIARVSLAMIFRRRLFWAMYALALMVFLLYFFGQYLMAWAASQLGEQDVRIGGVLRARPQVLVQFFRGVLKLDARSPEMFANFFWFQGYNVMIVLALAGSFLIGNDLRFGSLAFYLAKPISRWDYLLGKAIAVAVFVHLMTTLPAIALFVQYGLLESWDYFLDYGQLLVGVIGYGLILSTSMTLILLAAASWVRRTVPLIMTWTTLFFFCRQFAFVLVNGLNLDARWRLIDLWNDMYLLGNTCLGVPPPMIRPTPQPMWYEAALVLGGVSLASLSYLIVRIRAVEIVK